VSNEHFVLQHEPSAVPASDCLLSFHLKISRPEGNELNNFDFWKEGFAPWGQYIDQLLSHSNILLFLSQSGTQ